MITTNMGSVKFTPRDVALYRTDIIKTNNRRHQGNHPNTEDCLNFTEKMKHRRLKTNHILSPSWLPLGASFAAVLQRHDRVVICVHTW